VRLGLLGAMDAEVEEIATLLTEESTIDGDGRTYRMGRLGDRDAVLVASGFGKVSAAATVTTLLERFDVTSIVFTGVAGGLDPSLKRGDVVVADELAQHDFDASPIFPPFVIPSLDMARIPADPTLADRAVAAAGAAGAAVNRGLVLSGDRFIDSSADRDRLRVLFPDALAVEMEGAAVAQVCAERAVPFAVIRAISDTADEAAGDDFLAFVQERAAPLLASIVAGMR
jgi:adenosylhomocysteine nucleosidase